MSEIDTNSIIPTDRCFSLPHVRTLLAENVYKVGQRNALGSRIFVITSFGIFLLRKKGFGKYRIVNSIMYCELISIHVGGMVVSFSSRAKQIRIKHQTVDALASIVYKLRTLLFSENIFPISSHIPNEQPSIRADFITPENDFSANRLIGFAYSHGLDVSSNSFLNLIDFFTIQSQKRFCQFVFDKDLSLCPYLEAIVSAIAFQDNVTVVEAKDVSVAYFLSSFEPIFKYSKNVLLLKFTSVDFVDASPALNALFQSEHLLQLSHIVFQDCDVSIPEFSTFFDSLQGSITDLDFIKCNFSIDSLAMLFQSLLFNECFHNLHHFTVQNIHDFYDLPLQTVSLACSSWIITSHCFHELSISDCRVDAQWLLSQLLIFNIGLRTIQFRGSLFKQPLSFKPEAKLQNLHYLNLSNSVFTFNSFISIFDLLSSKQFSVSCLNLSHLDIEPNDYSSIFTDYFSKENQPPIESVSTLIWNENLMDSYQGEQFANFLSRFPKLTSISIDSSIDVKKSPEGLHQILRRICSMNILKLSIASDGSFNKSFGQLLNWGLNELLQKKMIKYLNLTNQGVPILQLIPFLSQLDTLLFDGSNGTPDAILSFCQKLLNSNVKSSIWPYQSFQRVQIEPKAQEEHRNIIQNEVDLIKEQFLYKINDPIFIDPDTNPESSSPQSELKSSIEIHEEKAAPKITIHSELFKDICNRDPEIDSLLQECIDTQEPSYVDPFLSIIENIQDQLSFDSLLHRL